MMHMHKLHVHMSFIRKLHVHMSFIRKLHNDDVLYASCIMNMSFMCKLHNEHEFHDQVAQ